MKCNVKVNPELTKKQRDILAEQVKSLFFEKLEEYDREFDAMAELKKIGVDVVEWDKKYE